MKREKAEKKENEKKMASKTEAMKKGLNYVSKVFIFFNDVIFKIIIINIFNKILYISFIFIYSGNMQELNGNLKN